MTGSALQLPETPNAASGTGRNGPRSRPEGAGVTGSRNAAGAGAVYSSQPTHAYKNDKQRRGPSREPLRLKYFDSAASGKCGDACS